MTADMRGKVALITGGNRGIGLGIATEFANLGCDLMLTARNEDALGDAATKLRSLGVRVETVATDLTLEGRTSAVVQLTREKFGRLDVLVNNAGGAKRGNPFTLTDADWADGFDLKFFAHVRLSREAWPMLQESKGSVVIISGIGARAPVADYAIGSTVCAACIAFAKALADIGKHHGVQVNVINPGSVQTDRMKHRIGIIQNRMSMNAETAIEHHRKELDITRFGKPEDIGALAAFIVSPKGSWIHGSSIDIDGGQICPLRMSIYD